MTERKRVIVVGGGPAGMMAAGVAGSRGLDVTLIEKNVKLGRKLIITGKGRCNLTNNTDVPGLLANVPVNGKFLYSAFYTFSNQDLVKFFNDLGLATKVERGERVFPVSDRSFDVLHALESFLRQNKVRIIQGNVRRIICMDGVFSKVVLADDREIAGESAVIATGGLSYPQTGSTGDGYRFAKELGHTVMPLKPSLVPLEVQEEWPSQAQGVALKNVAITIFDQAGAKIYQDFGEMLFTHFGVSGPIVLSASSYMRNVEQHQYRLIIDLKPALTEEQLDKRLQSDFEKYSRKIYANALDDLLPKKLIPIIINLSEIPADKPVNQLTRTERSRLGFLLKHLTLTITRYRPIGEAIITSGGVKVTEINPKTMESKLAKGVFFAGEVIDVDAYTGGFNLQIAFSTGYLAGMNC